MRKTVSYLIGIVALLVATVLGRIVGRNVGFAIAGENPDLDTRVYAATAGGLAAVAFIIAFLIIARKITRAMTDRHP